ncbi:MAG: efflux RND transporter permease subunit [Alphaproteobacteria bacterium]|nr:efflux RND transporter permease subunit [Alphaproteobacteria bacterium]
MNNSDDQSYHRGIIAWFANNHVAANILMMLFLVGGLFSLFNIRSETFPSIDPKLITISVPYPGATPYEVADSITSRIEEALSGTEGVKRISSTASEGYGIIQVELEDFANGDDVYNEVETAVTGLSDFPPEDAERPVITKVKITPQVLNLALHGDVPEATLKYWAETIENEIKMLDGIALTSVSGIRDYQISIEVSEDALREYGLSLAELGELVRGFSIDVPAGTIESSRGDILLRVQEKGIVGTDFENIVLRTLADGSKLYLGNIAKVVDGFEDENLISKFNGERAAFISISRSVSEDTLEIAKIVKGYVKDVHLPEGLSLTIQNDETIALKDRINLMVRNSILGFMLVFITLLLFLDLKLAFWTSVAIPVSFLGGLMVIYFLGYSINMITLFALIVVLGIVVDDAIVTGESIYESQQEDSDIHADHRVLKGVRNVIAPVSIGVSTTIAAFAPLLFSTGTLGEIIKFIPIVVIPVLIISLIEAYLILPAHLSNPKRWSKGVMAVLRNRFADGLAWVIARVVVPVAAFSMRWRYVTVAVFCGLVIITGALFQSGMVRFVFFPNVEGDKVTVKVTMEEGTPFAMTRDAVLFIEDQTIALEEELSDGGDGPFESISVSIGEISTESNPGASAGSSLSSNIGQVKIALVQSNLRTQSAAQIESMIRERIEDLPNVDKLEFESSLIGENPDVDIELKHEDESVLDAAAESLKKAIASIEGTKEVDDSFELGKSEYVFKLNDEGYAAGLTPAALGQQLRGAFFGLEVQRFQRGRSEVVVYVRYPEAQRDSLDALNSARIRLNDGQEVPLSSVADIQQQLGYSKINTVNGRRIVSVTADVDYAVTTPNDVLKQLRDVILPEIGTRYAGLSYSFEGESREQAEDMQSLGRNMLIALLLIYVLLGSQLRSYAQPIVIMSAIPFGIVGAVWGHFLLGYDLSFISMFGIVALTGVVVNDSVVLMDYFNTQRGKGVETFEAMTQSIARRFRPILLTSLTTSLGLLPMLLETSLQAQFLIPMVVSLATGIIFSTFVILLLIPCLVLIIDDVKCAARFICGMLTFNHRD